MMSSLPKPHKNSSQLLDEVVALLGHTVMQREIDEPLDAAAGSFAIGDAVTLAMDNGSFLEIVGTFVAHVYQLGILPSRFLTPRQARAEAVSMLERGYQGRTDNGYDGALRDAAKYGKEGLRTVFLSLSAIMKATQRRRYVRWVLATRIGCLDWPARRDLAEVILGRWGNLLDEDAAERSVEELMPACISLIQDYVGSDDSLWQVFSAPGRTRGGAS